MKTSKITVIICLWSFVSGVLLASCNGNGTPQGNSKPLLTDFDFLELGMEYDEVVTRVGEADRDNGSGIHLMVYELEDGTELILSFPSLSSLAAVYLFDPQSGDRDLILGSEG